MKTAGRENQNPRGSVQGPSTWCGSSNRSCSNKWAAKQEKLQPLEWCFLLTSTFIELTRQLGFSRLDVARPKYLANESPDIRPSDALGGLFIFQTRELHEYCERRAGLLPANTSILVSATGRRSDPSS